MKSSAKKIELASVDDLFSTEEGARMQSWKRFRKFHCLNCIPLGTTHSKSRMTKP